MMRDIFRCLHSLYHSVTLKDHIKKTGETTQLNLCQEKVLLLTKQLKDYEQC